MKRPEKPVVSTRGRCSEQFIFVIFTRKKKWQNWNCLESVVSCFGQNFWISVEEEERTFKANILYPFLLIHTA